METYGKSLNSVFLFRMRTATLMTALCVFMLAAGAANAVTYTDSSPQTTEGQNFIFTFSPVNPWNGGNGTFTVHARGDYTVGTSSEYLNWDIEGLVSDLAAPSAGGTVIQEFNYNDVEWEQSFTINDGLLNAITSDSSIAISIDLSGSVGYQIDPSKHFVEVELTYNASGSPCPPPPAPDNPDPCDGATNVPVDTCLSWSDSGVPPPPPPGDIVINEVDMDNGDWLELFNPTGSAVNLTGWGVTAKRTSDTTLLTIPPFTLAAGAYVVLHETSGADTPTDLYFSRNIYWTENTGSCALVDAGGVGIDFVRWSNSSGTAPSTDLPPAGTNWTGNDPWAPSNQSIHTLGRDGVSTDTDDGGDWENTCGADADRKTPGAANIGGAAVAVPAGEPQIDIDIEGYSNAAVSVQVVPECIRAALDSLIESSGILAGPIVLSSEGPCESGQIAGKTVTYTIAEEIAQVQTAAELGINTTSLLNVVVCGAESSTDNEDVQQKLLETGKFNTVSIINVRVVTPTLSELQTFDAAIVLSNSSYADATALGNVMADYMDAGGGVVCAVFEVAGSMSYNMRGRWLSGGYPLIPYSNKRTGSAALGIVHNPGHPVMSGIGSFHGGSDSYRPSTTSLNPGATCIAEWSDGSTLVAVKETASSQRVDLGFYPPSSDVWSGFWNSSTDGALLMANALTWVADATPGPECPTTWDVYLGTDPCSLELVASNLTDPCYCPGGLNTGETYFWQVIAKNPSDETPGNVWTFETEGGDPPDCNSAVPSVAEIWPPRHEWVDIEILDVNDPDGDTVSITITGITQDEPVAGHGSGRTSPDGMGVGTSVAHVRAERSGQRGNGRVYEISFEADDGTGNTCNGSVKVCVPHDQGQGHECIDDGQLYDSTATEMFSVDLNGDGIINQLDFNILVEYWLVSYELED